MNEMTPMTTPRHRLARNLAIAIGLGAGAAALAGSSQPPPAAANLRGTSLDGVRVAEAATTSAADGDAPDSDDAADAPASKRAGKRAQPPGDAALAGEIDLAAMERVDDHYEVPLADGRRAVLTLDPDLQDAAEKVLRQAKAPRGAVVVTATDGRVLAYAGRRTEDPKGGKDGIVDPSLLTTAWAPAASIVKIATAAALVDAGVRPHDEVCYHGGLRSVMESNLEDSRKDNRCNDLAYGLAHSQNAIIAKLVHRHLEPAQLEATAEALAFGGAMPAWAMGGDAGKIEVPAAKGVELGKTAAGFDGSWLSPVGGAMLANTFATGGMQVTPRLVAAVIERDGTRRELTPAPPRRVLSEATADAVAEMMVETCDSGSAAKAFRGKGGLPRSTKVAGKTGTLSLTSPFYLQYSWFVGFAPADQPEVSISVILGNTDLWWLKGHTAARMVLAEALADREH